MPGIGPRTAAAIKDAVDRARDRPDWRQTVNTATGEIRGGADVRRRRPRLPTRAPGEVVVVTGMTGAGRSTAAKELEDLGYFVVDNLPPRCCADVVRLVDESRGTEPADRGRGRRPLRVVLRRRCRPTSPSGATGRRTTLLFLEATDDVLVRRQEAARRPHPLQGERPAARRPAPRARRRWPTCAADADLVIDTSDLNVHQLTDRIAEPFGTAATTLGSRSR